MTPERLQELRDDETGELTAEELEAGWHWCAEFDFMLVGPESDEMRACRCLEPKRPWWPFGRKT